MNSQYIEVVVDVAAMKVDRPFHYRVPAKFWGQVQVGNRVVVPFGRRQLGGYVIGYVEEAENPDIKDILGVAHDVPPVEPWAIELAKKIAAYYLTPIVEVFRLLLPAGVSLRTNRSLKGKIVEVLKPVPGIALTDQVLGTFEHAPRQKEILQMIYSSGSGVISSEVWRVCGRSPQAVKALEKKGLVVREKREIFRDPLEHRTPGIKTIQQLTKEQENVLQLLKKIIDSGQTETVLLKGVTGSGKTEVYLQAIEYVLVKGKTAIVLVPEIALTPQAIERFHTRFGNLVGVLHSGLSKGERHDTWQRARLGELKVILGTRSAIFAPLNQVGLIVVDEEHETSYKQEESPRYHAREVAIMRAQVQGAVTLLGSATPALNSYYKAHKGDYRLLELPRRINERPLPLVHVVDMREELKSGNRRMFSHQLQEAISRRLIDKEKVILFLNRRGYASFILCRECGHVLRCPHCDVTLTYHLADRRLWCHYCNYTIPVPHVCPSCGGRKIRHFGTGTETVEEELKNLFPQARVLRMDFDTTRQRGSHETILHNFFHSGDVLVGTQMVAKGLDHPSVTLVGVVSADMSLHLPDFSAAERTFQLLTQVAGRAGRGELPGEVIIQTYNPGHYSISYAARQDYDLFYQHELALRKGFLYPPEAVLTRILFSGVDSRQTELAAREFTAILREILTDSAVKVMPVGPAPAPISKLKNRYRWHLLLKSHQREIANGAVRQAMVRWRRNRYREIRISVDVDPMSLL